VAEVILRVVMGHQAAAIHLLVAEAMDLPAEAIHLPVVAAMDLRAEAIHRLAAIRLRAAGPRSAASFRQLMADHSNRRTDRRHSVPSMP
jgi:hypothetical protein